DWNYFGYYRDLSTVVERLSKLPLEEREERRDYTMKADQLKELKEKLAEKSKILRDWKYPQNVEDLSQIKIMEDHLIAYLNGVRNR
ncbi:hypothetical protein SCA6_012015, partial [Theobroma cacao]